ncbi:hypothetical protein HDE_09809 [Halotydeus destructor]|nr:hypothetical protein HDE_09809 [Halotydeus destructor]
MKSLLIVSLLLAVADCHLSLDDIVDNFLKHNDAKFKNSHMMQALHVDGDVYWFRFEFSEPSHARRTSEATVTTGSSGPVVQWTQEEPARRFTGTIENRSPTSSKPRDNYQVSGHIALNPVNVSIQNSDRSKFRFMPKITLLEPVAVKSWSLDQPELWAKFGGAIGAKIDEYMSRMSFDRITSPNMTSQPFRTAFLGIIWDELRKYLQPNE